MRKYLKDQEDRRRQQWAQGSDWTTEALAVVQTLSDIGTLSFEDVSQFYGGDEAAVDVPIESLRLYPEEDDEQDDH